MTWAIIASLAACALAAAIAFRFGLTKERLYEGRATTKAAQP